jgi:large subunit ribosomal protein L13
MNKTFLAKPEGVTRQWFLVDAENQVLGRLAAKIALILRGKNKPTFTPHVDTGDFVVVINAEKVHLSGRKPDNMHYNSHSGFPGGFRVRSVQEVLKKHPERVLEHAVRGMLPKTTLGRHMLKKLKVYAGTAHPNLARHCSLYDRRS